MAVSERDRRILQQSLIARIGEQEADSLMELLPRVAPADLATNSDLLAVKADMLAVKSELQSDLLAVKSELKSDLQVLRAELTASFHRDMVRQTWIFVASMFAGLGAIGGLLH